MKEQLEIQRAHDALAAIILREVPNPWGDDLEDLIPLIGACDVLCWVLEHDHNRTFEGNLGELLQQMEKSGYIIRQIDMPDGLPVPVSRLSELIKKRGK